MEHKEYSSIENTYRSKTITKIYAEGKNEGLWCVTLKVHGSNFSIYSNNRDKIRFAKRSSFISDNNLFFNHEEVWQKQAASILKADTYLRKIFGDYAEIIFYGEIFGGIYPHKDVPKVNNQTIVQKGVYYSPENKFIIFDIKVNGHYLSYEDVINCCDKNEVLYCKPLFIGSFDECLKYPNEFPDPLHQQFGLPSIENNICEGVVIKPIDTRYFNDGSRIILKNKNDKFKEVTHGKKPKLEGEVKEIDPEIVKLAQAICAYNTENRLNNVVSKIGKVTNKDFGKILNMMLEDIRNDYIKDNGDFVLSNDLRKILMTEISILIRKEFLNLIDKE